MPVDRLLSGFLNRERDPDPDAVLLHECRHCGSKFDEAVVRCPVCEATEIATYEFPTAESTRRRDDPDGREAEEVSGDADGSSSDDD